MIQFEIVDMTPEMAASIVANNGRNRSKSRNRIEQIKGAIFRGEFNGLNGETIKVDAHGNLVDGQHRLTAIAEGDITVRLLMIRGVDPSAQETIDIGRARTFGDQLSIRRLTPNPNGLAAALRMVLAYEWFGIPHGSQFRVQPTPQQLWACLDRNPTIREWTRKRRVLVLPGSAVIALHYLFASADLDDADQFFTNLDKGDGLREGEPIFALRDRFIRALTTTDRMRDIVALAFTIRTWNAWRAGEKLTKLQWTGAHPDRFPLIEGCRVERVERDA